MTISLYMYLGVMECMNNNNLLKCIFYPFIHIYIYIMYGIV